MNGASTNDFSSGARLFPPGLETASPEQKKKYFFDVRISHEKLSETVNELHRLLDPGFEKNLIVLTGPSGVGKTIALEYFIRTVTRKFFEQFPDDMHRIPAVIIEAWGPERGSFDWQDFYESLLVQLQIPLIEDTLPPAIRRADKKHISTPLVEYSGTLRLSALRNRIRSAAQYRKPIVLAVDEASNILAVSESQTIKRQANTLKSIVNLSSSRIVLGGAYDLFSLLTQSGQLARRGAIVHFEPYSKAELEPFIRAMLTLQNHMPFNAPVSLEPYGAEIFRQSLGCVGLMKTILYKCLSLSLEQGRPVNQEILRKSYYKPVQLAQLKQEMLDGYKLVEGRDFFGSLNQAQSECKQRARKPSQQRRRPGQRNPVRDKA